MSDDKVVVNGQVSEASLKRLEEYLEKQRCGDHAPLIIEAERIVPVKIQDGDTQINFLSKLPRRFGRFIISLEMVSTASAEELDEAFKGIRILEAKVDIFVGGIVYTGWCEDFEELREYDIPPMYQLIFTKTDDGVERKIKQDEYQRV